MSLSREDIRYLAEALRPILKDPAESAAAIIMSVEKLLRDVAVPQPSRASELFAAYTLAIVLLNEQVERTEAKNVSGSIVRELANLINKRKALEETLQGSAGASPALSRASRDSSSPEGGA